MDASARERVSVSVDTNVISLVVSRSDEAAVYRRWLERFEPVITYFVQAEIYAHDWHPRERPGLNAFLSTARFLLPPGNEVIDDYVILKRVSVTLGLRYGTEREDLWMLAQSKAEGLAVMTNDRNAARVAVACDVEVLTSLRSIEEDYTRDRRRLARFRSL